MNYMMYCWTKFNSSKGKLVRHFVKHWHVYSVWQSFLGLQRAHFGAPFGSNWHLHITFECINSGPIIRLHIEDHFFKGIFTWNWASWISFLWWHSMLSIINGWRRFNFGRWTGARPIHVYSWPPHSRRFITECAYQVSFLRGKYIWNSIK